jgi:hypothetical protein
MFQNNMLIEILGFRDLKTWKAAIVHKEKLGDLKLGDMRRSSDTLRTVKQKRTDSMQLGWGSMEFKETFVAKSLVQWTLGGP